jgi:hypothetical protein
MHPKTGKLARELRAYDDQRVIRIYHNEDNNAPDTDDAYDDELEGNDEEDNRAVFDWYDLGCILDIIAGIVPPDDDGYDEFRFSTEERSGKTWPELESDFTGFVPVAFIRETKKVLGIGDTYIASQKIMLVKPKDASGTEYDLVEI